MNPWATGTVTQHLGGRRIVARTHAPLGRCLPYRRAAGEGPEATGGAEAVSSLGWSVVLGNRGLGDVILALALVRALGHASEHEGELRYRGPRPRLMQRCRLPMSTSRSNSPHIVHSGHNEELTFHAHPEKPQAWLDVLDGEHVEAHSALPMRYYLAAEQTLGVRLPADHAPLPGFTSAERERPFHVVFVSATSWPTRKDYGADGFALVTQVLTDQIAAPWSFTLITSRDAEPIQRPDLDILTGPNAVDCLDVFASAEVVIGNDTGLTHLAALTERSDGTGPQVIGLYGRHAHTKWTTGADRHHAIATPFSQMLAAADRCPVRDRLDDTLWSASADLTGIPAERIAEFATQVMGWR